MTRVMKNVLGGVTVAGLLLGVCALYATSAEARSEPAIGGNPMFGSQSSCFNESWGGVLNVCSGSARSWILPTTLDNNYGITMRVRARGVSGTANRVRCQAWSVDGSGGGIRHSSQISTVRHDGVTEQLNLGISPHGWGATYAVCWMDHDTLVRSFHY